MKERIYLMGLVAVLAFSGVAAADTVTYATTTPIGSTLTDWVDTLAFQKFNPSLGTLNSVKLDLSGSLSTVLTITNSSPSGSNGTAQTEVQMTVQDAGGNLIAPQIDLISPIYVYNLGAGQFMTSGTIIKSGNSSDTYTSSAVRSAFTGTGNIVLDASTFTQTLLANTGGNTAADQVTSAQLTGSVTYNYVPEPATISLLVLGGLAVIRRRMT